MLRSKGLFFPVLCCLLAGLMLCLCACVVSRTGADPAPQVLATTAPVTSARTEPASTAAETAPSSSAEESTAAPVPETTSAEVPETTPAVILTPYDPFADVRFTLESGWASGTLKAVYEGPYPLRLKQDLFEDLSNGQAVTLEIEAMGSFEPEEEGIRLTNTSRLLLVNGLIDPLRSPEEVTEESLQQLMALINRDAFARAEATWEDPSLFTAFQTEDVLTVRHDFSHTTLYLLLRGQAGGEGGFPYYSFARFDDVRLDPEGGLLCDTEGYSYPKASVCLGHIFGEGFEKDGHYYAGFETKDDLLVYLSGTLKDGETLLSADGALPVLAQPAVEPATVTMVTLGDMLLHTDVYAQALQPDGSYSYDFVFEHVTEYLKNFDLRVANNEVIIGGNEYGQRGYPCFNTRTEFGDAEIRAGLNIVLHSNNHARDLNLIGIRNCLAYWKENHPEMTVLGIHESAEAASEITVLEVNGIRIAMFNYTYGLNGLVIPDDQSYLVDRMDDSTWDKIGEELRRAEEIADFTVVFPHWGSEYSLQPNYSQKSWARWFVENGADLIIGNHPHCPQPVEWIEVSNGNKGLCYYSLGNFISNQGRTISDIGEMAAVAITKDSSGCHLSACGVDFEITWISPFSTGHKAVLLEDFTDEMAANHLASYYLMEDLYNNNVDFPMNLETIRKLTDRIREDLARQSDSHMNE